MKKHYRIIQIVETKRYTNTVEFPTDEATIKNIVKCLVGRVLVYLYEVDNSFVDLTKELGKFQYQNFDAKNVLIINAKFTAIKAIENNQAGSYFWLNRVVVENEYNIPKVIKEEGRILKLRAFYNGELFADVLNTPSSKELDRRVYAGNEYEKYIAEKYKEKNFTINYNGINKSYKDNGIDLIAFKENKIILIQCKNWKVSEYEQLSDKEFRLFFGDCFQYILDNKIDGNTAMAFHYIISDEQSMNKSAFEYLKRNKHIKFKCIPFEIR